MSKIDHKIITYFLYTVSLYVCVLRIRDNIKYVYKSCFVFIFE